jgi:hypothetical protein
MSDLITDKTKINYEPPKCTQCGINEGTDYFLGTKTSFILCGHCMTKNKVKHRLKKIKWK